jgi:GAF domain-containing protein
MVRPTDLLVTAKALQSRRWVRHLGADIAAFEELAQIPAADPHSTMQCLIDAVLRLYGAGSAGLSVLRPGCHGHADFVWETVRGALAAHQGDGTPGNFSPCALCLDIGSAIVLAHPERAFAYLAGLRPAIAEALIAPLYDGDGTPLGTLWVVHHEPAAGFGADDVLIIEQLARATAVALKRMQDPVDRVAAQSISRRHGTYRTPGPARVN